MTQNEPQTVTYCVEGGLKIVAGAWGDESNPAVLLLHGGGQTRHAWSETAVRLAQEGWYAVSLDARGHGDSDRAPHGNYSIDAFVADLRGVVAHFQSLPALVGASLGGITALLAAGEAVDPFCSALVLVDIAPRMDRKGVQRILSFMAAYRDGFGSVAEAADAVAAYLRHRSRPRDLSGLRKNLRRGENGRFYWHWDPAFLHNMDVDEIGNTRRMLAAATALQAPALLVRGGLSDVVGEEEALEFVTAVPHIQYVDVSGAGHMVAGDSNDAFTSAVIRFLSRHHF